jgi:hypothetical protein
LKGLEAPSPAEAKLEPLKSRIDRPTGEPCNRWKRSRGRRGKAEIVT